MRARRAAAALPILFVLGAPAAHPGDAALPRAAPVRAAVPPPPPVGFLDYRAADPHLPAFDTARAVNAAVPLARAPARVAPPFFVSGTIVSRARATDCLAAAAYYEAGSDARGQRAVMQVVLNRMRHPAYPQSVCGVVFQGAERRTGCQFTFTCDGAMTRHRPSAIAWQAAQARAGEALNGATDATVGHATHYHTDWVHPYWSRTLDKVAVVDTHLFFQARADRPGNFSAGYAGGEPDIARIAWLSSVHRGDDAPAQATMLASDARNSVPEAPIETASLPERLPDRADAPTEGIFLVTLDPHADPDAFHRMAIDRCTGFVQCKLIGWTDPTRRATRFPLPGTAIDAISFSFNRTGAGAPDRARWNCAEFKRPNPAECLNRG